MLARWSARGLKSSVVLLTLIEATFLYEYLSAA
jgi:hypothetical protein